ncbi:zinc finger protein 62 homolog [Armigeres subalbatus]|uniref:zinc finger protein 62 homolog n=1 Tax=Armigeres subalbatus TaxID=124917 RepID=UPI002ED47216
MLSIKTEPTNSNGSYQLCRLCMSEELLDDIFKEDNLFQWLSDYLSIVVSTDDHLSHLICSICRMRMIEFHQYRTRCQEVQDILQSMVGAEEVENENLSSVVINDPGTDAKYMIQLLDEEPQRTDSPIQCEVCLKTFDTKKQVINHHRAHVPKKHACERCGKSFTRSEFLNNHIKRQNCNDQGTSSELPIQCKVCHKIFNTKKQLTNHKRLHGPRKYVCERCGKSFARREQLVQHTKCYKDNSDDYQTANAYDETKNESLTDLRCVVIKNENADDMNDVIVIEEAKIETRLDSEQEARSALTNGQSKNETVVEPFKCEICQKSFLFRGRLKQHKKYTHGKKQHECPICGKPFAYQHHMQDHMRTHEPRCERQSNESENCNSRTFQCNFCQKTYKTDRDLVQHKRYQHGPKKHECHICGFRFSKALKEKLIMLSIKTELTNSNGSYQICRLCMSEELLDDIFKEENLYQWLSDYLSIVVSTDDHLSHLICSICRIRMIDFHQYRTRCQAVQDILQTMVGAEEVENENLSSVVIDEPGTDAKYTIQLLNEEPQRTDSPIQCEVSHKTFDTKKQVIKHHRAHVPKKYACERCGKLFQKRGFVSRHRKRSKCSVIDDQGTSSESPVQCEVCHKIFNTKKQLINHKREHGPIKYVCERCGKSFIRRERFLEHAKCYKHNSDDYQTANVYDETKNKSQTDLRCVVIKNENADDMNDVIVIEEAKIETRLDSEHEARRALTNGQSTKKNETVVEPLKCEICQKSFLYRSRLQNHKKYTHGKKQHECPICGKPIAYQHNIRHHMRTHEPRCERQLKESENCNVRAFKCNFCQKTYKSDRDLINHKRYLHGPKKHECHICGFRFSKATDLKEKLIMLSIKTEPTNSNGSYQICRLCMSEELLDDIFKEENLYQWLSDYLSIVVSTDDHLSHLICSICRIRMIEFHQYRTRCQEVQDILQTMVGAEEVENENLSSVVIDEPGTDAKYTIQLLNEEPQRTDSTIQYEVSHKTFDTNKQVIKHHRAHVPKKYACERCGKSFKKSGFLNRHIKSYKCIVIDDQGTSSESPIQCKVCHKIFKTKKQLINHKRVHGPKKYVCERCGKSFVRREQLLQHTKCYKDNSDDYQTANVYDETKNKSQTELRCVVIKNENADDMNDVIVIEEAKIETRLDLEHEARSALTNGQSTMKNETVVEPFKCEICQKSFIFRGRLQHHKKYTHGKKEHECPICGKPFAYQHHMQHHMRTHEPRCERQSKESEICNARAFKCNFCQKTYKSDRDLIHHKRYQHGPKKHECHICGFRFSKASRLAKHVRKHNREKDIKSRSTISPKSDKNEN